MRRIQAEQFVEESNNALVLDVRSSSEYQHAHLPGAISLPLFTDKERKVVGTTYKQISREEAIKIGLDYFGPKMRKMVEEVEKLIAARWPPVDKANTGQQSTRNIFIYCWRGGMRSGAVSWLLNLYGFNVTVLAGGYKAFRNYVLKTFEQPYHLKILGGYTGSGKTEVLHRMKELGETVIDLEGIACHKGSAFGSVNMPPQPTQEMFENILCTELLKIAAAQSKTGSSSLRPIWLEDESQRIGNLNIPNAFWQVMRESQLTFLDIPFEERLQHITEEYSQCEKQILTDAIDRIRKRLGPLETKTSLQFLADGNIRECFSILLQYYDKHYLKGLNNRENLHTLLTKVACEKVILDNAFLVSQVQLAP